MASRFWISDLGMLFSVHFAKERLAESRISKVGKMIAMPSLVRCTAVMVRSFVMSKAANWVSSSFLMSLVMPLRSTGSWKLAWYHNFEIGQLFPTVSSATLSTAPLPLYDPKFRGWESIFGIVIVATAFFRGR